MMLGISANSGSHGNGIGFFYVSWFILAILALALALALAQFT